MFSPLGMNRPAARSQPTISPSRMQLRTLLSMYDGVDLNGAPVEHVKCAVYVRTVGAGAGITAKLVSVVFGAASEVLVRVAALSHDMR